MSGNLDALFTEAVAKRNGIPSEQVMDAYINEQREKRIYPLEFFKNYEYSRLVDELLQHV